MALTRAYLRCPRCRGSVVEGANALDCTTCRAAFPIEEGIPRLLRDPEGLRAQIAALDKAMRWYPKGTVKMSLAAMMWIPAERVRLLRDLAIRPGQMVLDHCTGPGANLPTLAAAVGPTGKLVGMDLSGLVVRRARKMTRRRGIDVDIHQADALALPYADETFDAVVHYGAVSEFGDRTRTAVDEILRVTRPGGLIVLFDEGLVDHRRDSWWGRLLIWGNSVFASRPPLHALPARITPEVRWVIRGMFYEVRFRKPWPATADAGVAPPSQRPREA